MEHMNQKLFRVPRYSWSSRRVYSNIDLGGRRRKTPQCLFHSCLHAGFPWFYDIGLTIISISATGVIAGKTYTITLSIIGIETYARVNNKPFSSTDPVYIPDWSALFNFPFLFFQNGILAALCLQIDPYLLSNLHQFSPLFTEFAFYNLLTCFGIPVLVMI